MAKEAFNEIQILQSCAAGDAAAFEVIVRKYQSLVCAITYSAVGQVEKSEELAQQTFINAWKNLNQLNDLNNFKAWLIGITRNVIRTFFRTQKRDIVNNAAAIDGVGDVADESSEPLEAIITKEQQMMVEQSLQQIPEMYREPMVLFYRQQQSTKEVAEALDLTEETVRTRLLRGRKMLKEQVAAMVESTLSNTGPGREFTTMVVASIAGLALTSATAEAASGISSAAGTTTAASSAGSSGLATLTTGIAAKIITAAAVVAVGIGAVFAYKHLTNPEQSPTQSNEIAVVQDKQEPVILPEKKETIQPKASDIVATNPIETSKPQTTALPNTPIAATALKTEPITTPIQGEPAVEVNKTFKCEGLITNLDGLPVSNAKVILYHDFQRGDLGNHIVEETMSDDEGTFDFKTPLVWAQKTSHSYANDIYIVLVIHPDYAFAWQNIRQGEEQESYELILTGPISRTIKVTDYEDNPLSEVHVWPYNVGDRESGNLLFRDYLKLDTEISLLGGITDINGLTTITNLPQTRSSFRTTLDGYAVGYAFPADLQIRLTRGTNVRGRVLAEKNLPVEGAIVKFDSTWMHLPFLAETDAEGYFYFKDLPADGWRMGSTYGNGLYEIRVKHDKYSIPGENIQLLPGDDITDFIINAYSDGTLIKCNVVSLDTNMPVTGARIQGSSESGRIDGYSNQNGVFTVRVEPGPVSLFLASPPDGVYVLGGQGLGPSLRFEATGEEMEKTLTMSAVAGPLISVFGYVFDANLIGQSDAVIYAQADQGFETSTAGSYIRPVGTDYDGLFELKEVPAGLSMHVYAETKDRTLAGTGVFKIPSDPNKVPNIEVNLRTTQSCEKVIRDKNGNPVCNISFEIRPVVGGKDLWGGYNRIVSTDSEGVLRIDGILLGQEYYLRDKRLNQSMLIGDEWKKWFKGRVTLIPHEPVIEN